MYTSGQSRKGALCCCLLAEFDLGLLILLSEKKKKALLCKKEMPSGVFAWRCVHLQAEDERVIHSQGSSWRDAELHSSSGATFQASS